MKIFRPVTVFLLILFTMMTMTVHAAQRVGIVDIRAALLSSDSAKRFADQLKKDFADEESRLRNVGESAQKMQERLKKDTAIMSDSERTKLSSELEEKAQEFNFLKKKYQTAIGKREEQFLKESRPVIDKAIKAIAKSEKLDIVLPRKMAVYANPELDFTVKLVEALNAK